MRAYHKYARIFPLNLIMKGGITMKFKKLVFDVASSPKKEPEVFVLHNADTELNNTKFADLNVLAEKALAKFRPSL